MLEHFAFVKTMISPLMHIRKLPTMSLHAYVRNHASLLCKDFDFLCCIEIWIKFPTKCVNL